MTEKKYPLRLKDLLTMRPDATSWSRWSRRLGILVLITVGLMILGHLVIRFIVWPQLETSKPAVEKLLSQRIGVEVKINELNVYWQGIRPVFDIRDLEFVVDAKRNPSTISDALFFQRLRISPCGLLKDASTESSPAGSDGFMMIR